MGNHMFIRFKSDASIRGKGFTASFSSKTGGCGGRMVAPSGGIHSPNYPNPYDSNDDCAWLLEVDENHRIEFNFIGKKIEYTASNRAKILRENTE